VTLAQAELVLSEKEKYPDPIVNRAADIVMRDFYLDEIMILKRE